MIGLIFSPQLPRLVPGWQEGVRQWCQKQLAGKMFSPVGATDDTPNLASSAWIAGLLGCQKPEAALEMASNKLRLISFADIVYEDLLDNANASEVYAKTRPASISEIDGFF